MLKGVRARYIVMHDGERHVLLENGEIVIKGGVIQYVGPKYEGKPVTEWYDAGHSLITPGFINLHSHPVSTPVGRSLREEQVKTGKFFGLPFWIRVYNLVEDRYEQEVLYRYSLRELLRSGSTTALMMTVSHPDVLSKIVAEIGMRAYISPSFREATWSLEGPEAYDWDLDRGKRELERTLQFISDYDGYANGLVRGVLGPEQVDTCSPPLLAQTAALAAKLDVPVTTHVGQGKAEYDYILHTHHMTPVELLERTGLLTDRLIMAHCIYVSSHSLVRYTRPIEDIERIGRSGASVAHCPMVFARLGIKFESLARYRDAGVNVGLGTDSSPQDIVTEMRWATMIARIADGNLSSCTAAHAIDHATVCGAKALRRPDLGKIAPGCQADLVFFNLDNIQNVPLKDPVRNLIYYMTGQDVQTVMIAGKIVVKQGRVVGIDEDALKKDVQRVVQRVWARIPWIADGIDLETLLPPVIPRYKG